MTIFAEAQDEALELAAAAFELKLQALADPGQHLEAMLARGASELAQERLQALKDLGVLTPGGLLVRAEDLPENEAEAEPCLWHVHSQHLCTLAELQEATAYLPRVPD